MVGLCGEFPSGQLNRLIESDSYAEKVVTDLKQSKLIRTHYKDGLRGYRLTKQAKELLLSQNSCRFQNYLTGNAETNLIRSELPRRLRLHQKAETYLTLSHAGIPFFPDEKHRILNREKKGFSEDSISEELQKLVTKDYSSNISKATCNRAISWLYFSGIIGFCAKITEMDILDFKSASRCYFMDMGLANYYLTRTGTDSRVLAGTLNENYVYINLKKRQDFPPEISFETPAFATYRGGEIDFVAQSLSSSTRYLIEIKAGKGTASTAQKALAQGKADKLLYLKGATKGGIDGKTETLPIYLLEQYKFN